MKNTPEKVSIIVVTDQLIGYAQSLSRLSGNEALTGITETIRRKVNKIVKAARMLVSPDGKYKVKREIVSLARVGRGGRARGGAGTRAGNREVSSE